MPGTSEQAADLLETAYGSVAKSATDYNLKLIDFGRTNTRAAFDYANELWREIPVGAHRALDRAHAQAIRYRLRAEQGALRAGASRSG